MKISDFASVALVAVAGLSIISRPATGQSADTSAQRPTDVDGFTLLFPDGEDLEIIDINFNADTLPVGKTTTSFYISISLNRDRDAHRAGRDRRADRRRHHPS